MSAERVQPISPKEVIDKKLSSIPSEAIEAFNELIAQNTGRANIVVKQEEVVALMVKKGLHREQIFKNGWLDIEDIYRKAGWRVEYDKPGYNEDYEPTFTFRPAKGQTLR